MAQTASLTALCPTGSIPRKPEALNESTVALFAGIVAIVGGAVLALWGWGGGKSVVRKA